MKYIVIRDVFLFFFSFFKKVVVLLVLCSLEYYCFVKVQTSCSTLPVSGNFPNLDLSLLDIFALIKTAV